LVSGTKLWWEFSSGKYVAIDGVDNND